MTTHAEPASLIGVWLTVLLGVALLLQAPSSQPAQRLAREGTSR